MAETEVIDPTIKVWQDRRTIAESAQIPIYKKFKGYYDQFYSVVKNISSPWRSKLWLPEFFSVIWVKAAILTAKPFSWEVSAREDADTLNAEVAKKVLEYQIKEPHVQPSHYKRFTTGTLDALITGTAIYSVPFRISKDYFHQYGLGKDGLINTKEVKTTSRVVRWNEFEPIEHTRFFKDPYSDTLQGAQWIIIRQYLTANNIKGKNAITPGYYVNLNQLDGLEGATDQLGHYNVSRNNLLGLSDKIAQDKTVKYVEVWCCYEKKYDEYTGEQYVEYSEIAGGKTYIRKPKKQENWHGLYPFAVQYDYDRPHEFWGIGEIEANESIVKGMNDNLNHFMDNLNLSNNSMIIRRTDTDVEPFIIEPGGEVIYDGDTAPQQFRFPDPNGQTFQIAHGVLKATLDKSTGVDGYMAGSPSSSVDKTRGTKGGIEAITQNAQGRMAYSMRQSADFLEQVGRIWLSNVQQFFTEDFMVRLTDNKMVNYAPEEVRGEMDVFVADDSLTPTSKGEKLDMIMGMLNTLNSVTPALAAEGKQIKVSELVKRYINIIGGIPVDGLLGDLPPTPPNDIKKNVAVTFAGEKLPPQIQAEILAEEIHAGDNPTPTPNEGGTNVGAAGLPSEMPQDAGMNGMALDMPPAEPMPQGPQEMNNLQGGMNVAGPTG